MTAKTAKPANYTDEQTVSLLAAYAADKSEAALKAFALTIGKTLRSVVAKLAREKVYIAKAYVTKTGEKVAKKDATADAIGAILELTEAETESLTKANKTALVKIFTALANSVPLEA